MAEIYKGYAIEYIDYRGDYRIFDPSVRSGTFNYAASVEEARQVIDDFYPDKASEEISEDEEPEI